MRLTVTKGHITFSRLRVWAFSTDAGAYEVVLIAPATRPRRESAPP